MKRTKGWAQLIEDIETTVRRWGVASIEIDNSLSARSRRKAYHDQGEREVRVSFWLRGRRVRADVRAASRAEDNLHLIAIALEMMRMAEVRGVDKILALLYRQAYPAPAPEPTPAQPRKVPPHYAILYLDTSAPLPVAEAAYRALARTVHPDAGGSTEAMSYLNDAIARIRAEKGSQS